jgi:hypothetical protein
MGPPLYKNLKLVTTSFMLKIYLRPGYFAMSMPH